MTSPHFDTSDIAVQKEKILACFGLYLAVKENMRANTIIKSLPAYYNLFDPTYKSKMLEYSDRYQILSFSVVKKQMDYLGKNFQDNQVAIKVAPNIVNNVTNQVALKICTMLTYGIILLHPRDLTEGVIRNHTKNILKDVRDTFHPNIIATLPDGVIDNFIKHNFKSIYDDIESTYVEQNLGVSIKKKKI